MKEILLGAYDPSKTEDSKSYVQNEFTGNGLEFFKIAVSNLVLTILTLGIYSFWARVRTKKYLYRNFKLLNQNFNYHASGKEKFLGFLRALLYIVPVIGGLYLIYEYWPASMGNGKLIAMISFYLLFFALQPLIAYGKFRFEFSRMSWNNIRFRYDGKLKEFSILYFKNIFLLIITVGIYSSWMFANLLNYHISKVSLGTKKLKFDLDGGELFFLGMKTGGVYLIGTAISFVLGMVLSPELTPILIIPVFLFVQIFYATNFLIMIVEAISLEDTHMKINIEYSEMFKIIMVVALSILPLGLALPWGLSYAFEKIQGCISVLTFDGFENIDSNIDNNADVRLDQIGDAASAVEEIGSFFT